MSCLHLLNKSPFSGLFDELRKALGPGDSLLLFEDGVYYLKRVDELEGLTAYFLAEDLRARGLTDPMPANASTVDYDGFVSLCASHDKTVSWF